MILPITTLFFACGDKNTEYTDGDTAEDTANENTTAVEETDSDSTMDSDTAEPTPPDPIISPIGEWELYRLEKQELYFEGFNDDYSEAIHSMKWYNQTSSRATESTIIFHEDNSIQNFYADVLVGEGTWTHTLDGTYSFMFNDGANNWSDLTDTYTVNMHCSNTMSIQYLVPPPAGSHGFQEADWSIIAYHRMPGTYECDDSIGYKVSD